MLQLEIIISGLVRKCVKLSSFSYYSKHEWKYMYIELRKVTFVPVDILSNHFDEIAQKIKKLSPLLQPAPVTTSPGLP